MRTVTPPQVVTADGRTVTQFVVQRHCNGCHQSIGDATDAECLAPSLGLPLPDVRHECATCNPAVHAGPVTTGGTA
jgi:hypothetical protein